MKDRIIQEASIDQMIAIVGSLDDSWGNIHGSLYSTEEMEERFDLMNAIVTYTSDFMGPFGSLHISQGRGKTYSRSPRFNEPGINDKVYDLRELFNPTKPKLPFQICFEGAGAANDYVKTQGAPIVQKRLRISAVENLIYFLDIGYRGEFSLGTQHIDELWESTPMPHSEKLFFNMPAKEVWFSWNSDYKGKRENLDYLIQQVLQ